jgi:hypothetical protein
MLMGSLLSAFTILISLLTNNAHAQALKPPIKCIAQADLKKVAASFPQLQKFVTNKAQYCESDMDPQWLKIANSLVILYTMKTNEPTVDPSDALTLAAVTEKDWWSYVTTRANKFSIETNCQQNVVAYVQPFFGAGTVHICQLFFDVSVYAQASTLMHEVRHFEGFGHVTCSQGFESGVAGGCDKAITDKGSYAVTVQTLVGMARSTSTDPAEVDGLESEAVYSAFNKFNQVPQVKMTASLILSNTTNEVYRWTLNKGIELLGTLSEPARIFQGYKSLTLYPTNTNSDAYRKDVDLVTDIANPGLYAKTYNAESPAERAKYKGISYMGAGGILKGNSLFTLCKAGSTALNETNLDSQGQFTSLINISKDPSDLIVDSMLVADNGEIFSYSCDSAGGDNLKIDKTNLTIPSGSSKIVSSFGINGQQLAVLDNGTISEITIVNNVLNIQPVAMPLSNKNWVSATPFSKAEVF